MLKIWNRKSGNWWNGDTWLLIHVVIIFEFYLHDELEKMASDQGDFIAEAETFSFCNKLLDIAGNM
jgi:hypothetical protein